jgi:hypothetical protein
MACSPPTAWREIASASAFCSAEICSSFPAFNATLSGGRTEAGAVYLFEESGGTWSFSQKLTASDAATGDRFGASLAMSGDRLIVGAYLADAPSAESGAAYIFERDIGGVWNETAKLAAADGAADDRFGWAVDIEGDRAIVGAYVDDNAGGADAGAAYVFDLIATTWTQTAKILNAEALPGDTFGRAVALSGGFAVVSALGRDEGGHDGGAAYIFEDVGGTWTQRSKLTADPPTAEGLFGWNVCIEGTTAVVGAVGDATLGANAGRVHVFRRDTTGDWSEVWNSAAPNTGAGDAFGVAVSLDGDRILCGAIGDDDGGADSGAAWILTIPPSSAVIGSWGVVRGVAGKSVRSAKKNVRSAKQHRATCEDARHAARSGGDARATFVRRHSLFLWIRGTSRQLAQVAIHDPVSLLCRPLQ